MFKTKKNMLKITFAYIAFIFIRTYVYDYVYINLIHNYYENLYS